MTDIAATRHRSSGVSAPRRVAGLLVAVAVAVGAVLFVLGAWNPWQLVVLRQHFGSPVFGLVAVGAGSYLALWLLTPVRNEAVQRGRITARICVAVLVVIGLIAWALFGGFYRFEVTELARSDDGARTVVAVTNATTATDELRIWDGTGLPAREVGTLGRRCGQVSARFLAADRVELTTAYGTWEFALDPATGAPLEVLGWRCTDGPIPATLGQ